MGKESILSFVVSVNQKKPIPNLINLYDKIATGSKVVLIGEKPDWFKDNNITFYFSEYYNKNDLFSTIKTWFSLRRIIKNESISIVHNQGINQLIKTLHPFMDLKNFLTLHQSDIFNNKNSSFKIIISFLDVVISKYILVSEWSRNQLVDLYGIKKEKIITIPNPAPDVSVNQRSLLMNKKKYFFDESKIYVVNVANYYHECKNQQLICDIAENKEFSNVHFYLIGEGPLLSEIKKKCNSSNVSFLGWLDQPDVLSFLKLSNIFILSSTLENYPYSILEAGLCKKICVCSNVGGVNEIIKNGYNGYLFNPNNEKELVEILIKIISNYKVEIRKGQKLYDNIIKKNSIHVIAKKYLDAYNL
jgi:glycosyltransferase involved in cell wall biosynthesis